MSDHNKRLIDRIKGAPSSSDTSATDSGPHNPTMPSATSQPGLDNAVLLGASPDVKVQSSAASENGS
jgi:hypothetical protein